MPKQTQPPATHKITIRVYDGDAARLREIAERLGAKPPHGHGPTSHGAVGAMLRGIARGEYVVSRKEDGEA